MKRLRFGVLACMFVGGCWMPAAYAIEGFGLGPDVDAGATMMDLAKIPAWLDALKAIGVVISDHALNQRLQAESENLRPLLERLISVPGEGALIYTTVIRGTDGTLQAPAGSLLGLTGIGQEPIDALAESYRQPALKNLVSGDAQQVFFWVTRRSNGSLISNQIPVFANARLVAEATKEALRRNQLASVITSTPNGQAEALQLSAYWSDVEKQRIQQVNNQAYRDEIARLTAILDQQNRDIDAKYQQFQAIYADYQKSRAYQAALQNAQTVVSLIDGAIKVGNAFSGPKPLTSGTAPEDAKLAHQVEVTRQTTEILLNNARTMRDVLKIQYDGILIYEGQLNMQWQKTGVPLPAKSLQANPFDKYQLP